MGLKSMQRVWVTEKERKKERKRERGRGREREREGWDERLFGE